jgi:4-hydroxybenzoate polyprenyltransferase/geranylgeranylglycerol-phosphate geranylgeranyltransferase
MSNKGNNSFTIKERVFAHIEIWRPYTVIWCGLVSLAGSCVSFGQFPPLRIALLVTFIPMIGWISGLYLIDIIDRKLDVIQKPHRPIPSGRIKRKEALIIGAILVSVGFILTIYLNYKSFFLVFIVAFLVFTYAKFTKSRGIFGNLNRGAVTVVAYFFGVFSIDPVINNIPVYVWLLSIVFLIHDVNSNMIGAIRDIDGDKKGGYITLPVKYGVKKVGVISVFLSILFLSIIIFTVIQFAFVKFEFYYLLIIDVIILISLYVYFIISLNNFSRKKALNYHKFLVIERIILASAFILGIADIAVALIVLFTALIITGLSQYILRDRYEFKEIQ